MNVLLVGSMSDNPQKAYEIFETYRKRFIDYKDFVFLNPLELIKQCQQQNLMPERSEASAVSNSDWHWVYNLENCLSSLLFMDAIYLIPLWHTDQAAIVIFLVAQKLGLKLLRHDTDGDLVESTFDFQIQNLSSGQNPSTPEIPDTNQGTEESNPDKSSDDSLSNWFNQHF